MWRGALLVLALAMMPDCVAAQSEIRATFRTGAPAMQPLLTRTGSDAAAGASARVPAGWAVSRDQRVGSGGTPPELPRGRRVDGFVEVTLPREGLLDPSQPVTWLFAPL